MVKTYTTCYWVKITVIICKVSKTTGYISSATVDTSICGHVFTCARAHTHTHMHVLLQMNGKCQH